MERRAFALGVAFGFSGVLALAIGFGVPLGPDAEAASSPPQLAAPVLAAPATAAPSIYYFVPAEPSAESSVPFGRLQADGTYCAVNCADEGY
ncbi:MAG: hypothetical protein HYY42_04355, partial [Chloroflexi bacterium]|nr:hypothetical protein [Chloroflexota bacterium]